MLRKFQHPLDEARTERNSRVILCMDNVAVDGANITVRPVLQARKNAEADWIERCLSRPPPSVCPVLVSSLSCPQVVKVGRPETDGEGSFAQGVC